MGPISVKTYAPNGSLLNDNQQVNACINQHTGHYLMQLDHGYVEAKGFRSDIYAGSSLMLRCAVTLIFFFMSCSTAYAGEKPATIEYSWLTENRITGSQTVSHELDGLVRIHFEYKDRGRGPDFESLVRLNSSGYPQAFNVTGVNNTRAKIDESFLLNEGIATWRTSREDQSRPALSDTFYLPVNDSPEVRAMLARVLIRDPDRTVALLPNGTVSISLVTSQKVALNDRSETVTLYAIKGLSLEPTYVWLDEDLELFGYTEGTFATVRKGWEVNLSALRSAESEATDQFYIGMVKPLSVELSGLTVIRGARVFDSSSGHLTPPAHVFIWNGKISAVYYRDTDIPEGAKIVDGTGRTLLPALWDMHNHVVPAYLPEYLAFGITNVRDMGSNHEKVQHLLNEIQLGRLAGPDSYPMGFIDKAGPFAAPVGKSAATLDQALGYVEFYARHGYHGIKLYSAIEPDWIPSITKLAHERGLTVAGHIPAFVSTRGAVLNGYDEITHFNQFLMAFFNSEKIDTRGPQRFLVPGKQAGDLDINSEEVGDFIEFMHDRHVALDTTLAPLMEMFRNRPGRLSPMYSDIADHLPDFIQRKVIMTQGYNAGNEMLFSKSSDTMLKLTKRLHERGIVLLPGTDSFLPGFTLIRELIYYTEAGISPGDVLRLATLGAARHMKQEHRLGSIEVGKEAYMHLVDGDPTQDITALYRTREVFKGRTMYYGPDLLKAQGFVPFLK